MLNTFQSVFLLLCFVVASLAFNWALKRVWPSTKRREHNDQIGWQLSVLGTTYAVILGFMLYAVWNAFGAADLNVDLEANALVNLYRIADALPEQQRTELRKLARDYADEAVREEWPQMNRGEVPSELRNLNPKMWEALTSIKSASAAELMAEDHALSELSALSQYRRTRILQSSSRMPTVLWALLIAGGILSIVSCCLFGSNNEALHSLQVFAFSFLIALALVAIGDINRPFQGWVHVGTVAFERAQQNMQLP